MTLNQRFFVFLVRWLLNSFGLWVAVWLLGTGYSGEAASSHVAGFLLAGLIFSLVNTILKPMLIILSLPAILLSLGLFMLVVNGVMVYISLKMVPGDLFTMTFINSILTGMILSLINYIVSAMIEINRPHNSRRLI